MVVRIIEGCNPVTVPPAAAVQDMGNVFCKLAVDTEQAVNLRMAVEEPCQKRNAAGAAVALVSAQIALAGIGNLVDFDQTVEAMRKVGRTLPFELRESALGGIAAAPTACAYCPGCN